jgi:hypothetical protein
MYPVCDEVMDIDILISITDISTGQSALVRFRYKWYFLTYQTHGADVCSSWT